MFHTRPIPRPNAVAVPGSSHMIQQPGAGRQSSIRKNSTSSGSSGSSWSSGSSVSSADPRLQLSDISRSLEGLSLSSTSSNRDSMTTVMSDGGFTDYLSDESEAELQRQAEEAAALLRRVSLPLPSLSSSFLIYSDPESNGGSRVLRCETWFAACGCRHSPILDSPTNSTSTLQPIFVFWPLKSEMGCLSIQCPYRDCPCLHKMLPSRPLLSPCKSPANTINPLL